MNDQLSARLEDLKAEAMAAAEEVGAAIESGDAQRELATGKRVEQLAQRYKELLVEVGESERDQVERTLGRRITDLRRAGESLTRRMSGAKAERSREAGFVPFLEQRAPGRSMESQRHAPNRHAPRYSVGGEVDAWCGKCKDFRQHNIVALVGDTPKQVICQTCRSRHGYRTEPGRNAPTDGGLPMQSTASFGATRTVDPEAVRKAAIQRVLHQELDAAENPRAFDPRGRYKANEIIVHAEFGRGKIENVLKGSLLVRFRDRLRPLNTK